jgi:capsular polysaccharide biosynthesis protein/Mrp family chromosome partitioning ATPase
VTSPAGFDDRYDDPDQLRDQVRRLLRYRATIAVGVLLGLLGGVLLVLLRAGSYTSTGEVLVRPRADPFSTFGVAADNQVSMGTEQQLALSATVAARAAKALRQPSRADALLADLRVTNPPDTQVLRFEYTAGSAQRAARVTNAFAQAYLADRQNRSKDMVTRMTTGMERQITALSQRVNAMKSEGSKGGTAGMQQQIGILQKRVSDIRAYDTAGGDIVRRAEPPAKPSGPGPAWLIALGLVGGLILGVVLAWLRSALEPRARSVGEVQGALGAPVLGILPAPGTGGELLEVGRAEGSRAEAYRTLAFRLRGGDGGTAVGTLMIVAPKREGGAEAVAVNLAAALAESGDDVLLVDAVANPPGLAARLPLSAGDCAQADVPAGGAVVDAGTAGRFTLRPDSRGTTGDDRPGPMAAHALSCAEPGRPTLFLTPPLLEHTDALSLAQRVDGVLVVGALDDIRRDDLKRVRELINCSGGRIVGAALHNGTRRSLLRRVMGSDRLRRTRERNPVTTPSASADDAVGQPAVPVQDDTLSASR